MRVCIVSEYARPWPGGISEHVFHEAAELRRRGHHVRVLTGPGPTEPGVTRLRRALRFEGNGAASRLCFDRRLLAARRLLAGFDVVHVHAPLDPALGLVATLAAPCPVVGTFHASLRPALAWDLLYGGPLARRAWARLRVRIAVSEEARRSVAIWHAGACEIVPNGVDCARFRPGEGGGGILFVGRPDPRKGLPVLLEAYARLRRTHPDAALTLVGVSGLPGAAGVVSAEALPARIAACDVLCAPSLGGESQGIVLLEGMAAGRAVVASDIPGYRGVVTHSEDGWLVPPGDPTALAEALRRLLDDPGLRAALGRRARQTALDYDWPLVVDRLERILEGACGRR